MQPQRVVLVAAALALALFSSPVLAQRGGGGRGGGSSAGGGGGGNAGGGGGASRPSVAVAKVTDVTKMLLAKITLDKPQKDTLQKLEGFFKDAEKKAQDDSKAATPTGGRGPDISGTLALFDENYIDAMRPLLTPDQLTVFNENLLAYQKKYPPAAPSRGRGRGN